MAIAFDAASTATGSSGTSLSWSHTCTGSDLILLVALGRNNTAGKVNGVTYNSVALTALENPGTGVTLGLDWWYLIAPATGANTVAVSYSADVVQRAGIAVSYTGVHQTAPFPHTTPNTGASTSTTPSAAVQSEIYDLVVDAVILNNSLTGSTLTVDGSQNQRAQTNTGAGTGHVEIGCSDEAWSAGTTTTMSWTLSVSKAWSLAGIALRRSFGTPPGGDPETFGTLTGWVRVGDSDYADGEAIDWLIQSGGANVDEVFGSISASADHFNTFHTDGPNGQSYARMASGDDLSPGGDLCEDRSLASNDLLPVSDYLKDDAYTIFHVIRVHNPNQPDVPPYVGPAAGYFNASFSEFPDSTTIFDQFVDPEVILGYGFHRGSAVLKSMHSWVVDIGTPPEFRWLIQEIPIAQDTWYAVVQYFDGTEFHTLLLGEAASRECCDLGEPRNTGDITTAGFGVELANLATYGDGNGNGAYHDLAEWGIYDGWIGSTNLASLIAYLEDRYGFSLATPPACGDCGYGTDAPSSIWTERATP